MVGLWAAVALLVVLSSCQVGSSDDAIVYLNQEVYLYEETEPGNPAPAGVVDTARNKSRRVEDFRYRLIRVAQVVPVQVQGVEVQANDLLLVDDHLYVSYNSAGAEFAGALQVIDIANQRNPRVVVEIGLPDADVNAVAVDGSAIYIAGAWDPDAVTFPEFDPVENDRAFVARIDMDELSAITPDQIADRKVILPSYASTGVAVGDSHVYVSTGALDGEVMVLDTDLTPVATANLEDRGDFRDIEVYHGGAIALQGTDNSGLANGRVVTVRTDGSERDTLEINDFGSPEAKATIEVYDRHYGFLGLSEAGFQIVYLRESTSPGDPVESLFSIANPTVDWSDLTSTNSASYADDMIFTANGEAGFRAFLVSGHLHRDTPPADGFTTLIGFVPFDETGPDANGHYWSANQVEYQSIRKGAIGYLAVACGVGGVNLYLLVHR
jgi:hypothetical protein